MFLNVLCDLKTVLNYHFRYADEASINNEVLVTENGQLKEVKVKDVSSVLMQGNTSSLSLTFWREVDCVLPLTQKRFHILNYTFTNFTKYIVWHFLKKN